MIFRLVKSHWWSNRLKKDKAAAVDHKVVVEDIVVEEAAAAVIAAAAVEVEIQTAEDLTVTDLPEMTGTVDVINEYHFDDPSLLLVTNRYV